MEKMANDPDTNKRLIKPIYTHTSLYVKDMYAAVKFYTEILGMKLIRRRKETPQDNAERAFLASDDGPYRIELTLPKTGQPYTEKLDHIAFNFKNLDEVLEGLKQKGMAILKGPVKVLTAPIRVTFIKDNDDIMIELIQHSD